MEHQEFFQEGKEAEFFSTSEELVEKVKFYSRNESARKRIAAGGYERCVCGKYAYVYRLRSVLDELMKILDM